MNKYLEILQIFVGKDRLRPPLTVPNIGDKYASATDGHALVFFDKRLLPDNTTFETVLGEGLIYPDIDRFTKMKEICNNILDLEKVNSVLSNCPLIEDCDEEEKEEECTECDGSGEVEFEYQATNKKFYYNTSECPICEGDGTCLQTIKKPNGKMVKNEEYYLQCGTSYFYAYLVEKILKVKQIIGGDISIVNQTYPNKEVLFKIGNVKVVIMPIMRDELSKYYIGTIG